MSEKELHEIQVKAEEEEKNNLSNALRDLATVLNSLKVMSLTSSPSSSVTSASSSALPALPVVMKAPKLHYKRTTMELKRSNFIDWDLEFRAILTSIGYLVFITDPSDEVAAQVTFPANVGYEELNSQLYVMMIRSMTREVRDLFVNSPIGYPRALYQAIHRHFIGSSQAMIRMLMENLYNMKLKNKDFRKFDAYAQKIRSMATRLNAMGERVTEQQMIRVMLKGLGSRFRVVKAVIDASNHTSYDVIVQIIRENIQRDMADYFNNRDEDDGGSSSDELEQASFVKHRNIRNVNKSKNTNKKQWQQYENAGKRTGKAKTSAPRNKRLNKHNNSEDDDSDGEASGNDYPGNRNGNVKQQSRCFNCNSPDHFVRDCPKPKKKCAWCGLLGHTKDQCRIKKAGKHRKDKAKKVQEVDEDDGDKPIQRQ